MRIFGRSWSAQSVQSSRPGVQSGEVEGLRARRGRQRGGCFGVPIPRSQRGILPGGVRVKGTQRVRLQEGLLSAEEAEMQERGNKGRRGSGERPVRPIGCGQQRALRLQTRQPESAVYACVSGAELEESQDTARERWGLSF